MGTARLCPKNGVAAARSPLPRHDQPVRQVRDVAVGKHRKSAPTDCAGGHCGLSPSMPVGLRRVASLITSQNDFHLYKIHTSLLLYEML